MANDVLTAVEALSVPWKGEELKVGVTIGVAMSYPQYRSLEAWVEAADHACYTAKAAGRNTVHFASSAMLLPSPGDS